MNEVSKVGSVAPLYAKGGGTSGDVRGVTGEDMPGAEWTGEVNLGGAGDGTSLLAVMRCAVSVGVEKLVELNEEGPLKVDMVPAALTYNWPGCSR